MTEKPLRIKEIAASERDHELLVTFSDRVRLPVYFGGLIWRRKLLHYLLQTEV